MFRSMLSVRSFQVYRLMLNYSELWWDFLWGAQLKNWLYFWMRFLLSAMWSALERMMVICMHVLCHFWIWKFCMLNAWSYVVLFVSQLMTRTENENRSFIHLLSSVIRKRGCVFSENVNVFGRSIAKTTWQRQSVASESRLEWGTWKRTRLQTVCLEGDA